MIHKLKDLSIRTDHWSKPGPVRCFDWTAVDDDNYDGAQDSTVRNTIGYGSTEAEAIVDFLQRMGDIEQ